MKILYISDLDGTLLNKDVELSENTKAGINKIVASGDYFTAATARSYATVKSILSGVKVNAPIVLMNGVCIYNTEKEAYEKVCLINRDCKEKLIRAIKGEQVSIFVYVLEGNELSTYYENVHTKEGEEFIKEREIKYNKVFTQVKSFVDIIDKNWIYMSVADTQENLQGIFDRIEKESDLHIEYYHDIYNLEHMYLEVCSCEASKFSAVTYLREKYGYDKIIGFGDNLNDIPLSKACDEFYAVANAKDEVKKVANAILDSNNDDGVIKYILNKK